MSYGPDLAFVTLVALLGSCTYGYQLGVLNTPLPAVASDLHFPIETSGAAAVSALLLGGVFGSLAAGHAADEFGPKRAMTLNSLILAAGCIFAFFTPGGFAGLTASRILTGFASGGVSLFVPRYLAETAPPAIRGAIGNLSQISICTGILLSSLAGLPYVHSGHPAWHGLSWWRFMLLFPAGPALIQAALLTCCPESPVWLQWRGRHEEALLVEARLHVAKGDPDAEDAAAAAADPYTETLLPPDPDQEGEDTSWAELLRPRGRYSRMLLLAIGIPMTQQLSGINTITFYSANVFSEAGLKSPILGTILVGIVNAAGTGVIAAGGITDRLGRKPLLVLSHAGMAASLLGISLYAWIPGVPPMVALVCVLVFVIFFSVGAGPLPFLYMSEILSSSIKGKVSSIAVSLNWVENLAVGLTFPVMLNRLGIGGAYLVYALFNVACACFCSMMLETKQRSMHQIQRLLGE